MATGNGIASLAEVYPCKNAELRGLSKYAFECARNTVKEGASGATIGADPHFEPRQKKYVSVFRQKLEELHDRPIPDAFGLPDTQYEIDLSESLNMVQTDKSGAEIPLNEDIELQTQRWMTLAVALARSDSAGWRGGMNEHDYTRAKNAADVIESGAEQIGGVDQPDFAATADPGAKRATGAKKA